MNRNNWVPVTKVFDVPGTCQPGEMQVNIDITKHGAVGDGVTLNTGALQRSVDNAHAAGGGTVTVPPGTFRTGMIYLRDRVRLHLEAGAVIEASPRVEDHPKRSLPDAMGESGGWSAHGRFHLIAAVDCRDVAITGQGTIDGNGMAFYEPVAHDRAWPRGFPDAQRMCTMVQIERCQDVRIEGVTLTNVSFWTLHLQESDRVFVHGIRIVNPHNAPNADGIDITGCRGVMISDCHIDTCDDAIVLKTFLSGRSCENVTVTNCVLRTDCAGLKLGCNESYQDMRHIVFSNCVVRHSHRAVALYTHWGATLENIAISNIVCDTCVPLMFPRPIHVEAFTRDVSRLSAIRNVSITNFIGQTNGRILIAAAEGASIENIRLRDVCLDYVTVEDPGKKAASVGGAQFARFSPWARTERAALVAENIRDLIVDGFDVRWPTRPSPAAWQFERKAANGCDELFAPADWGEGAPVPFAVASVRNVNGGYLRASRLEGWGGAKHALLAENSVWPAGTLV
jgi:polygalacturonase